MGGLGGKVAIIGTGTIKFGENFHQSLSDTILHRDVTTTLIYTHVLNRRPATVRSLAGPDVRPMTKPAGLKTIRIGIDGATAQPIPTREGRSTRTQGSGSKGPGVSSWSRLRIGIRGRSSGGLPSYADQPIQRPNSSSATDVRAKCCVSSISLGLRGEP